jgi:hypothetical protein
MGQVEETAEAVPATATIPAVISGTGVSAGGGVTSVIAVGQIDGNTLVVGGLLLISFMMVSFVGIGVLSYHGTKRCRRF